MINFLRSVLCFKCSKFSLDAKKIAHFTIELFLYSNIYIKIENLLLFLYFFFIIKIFSTNFQIFFYFSARVFIFFLLNIGCVRLCVSFENIYHSYQKCWNEIFGKRPNRISLNVFFLNSTYKMSNILYLCVRWEWNEDLYMAFKLIQSGSECSKNERNQNLPYFFYKNIYQFLLNQLAFVLSVWLP